MDKNTELKIARELKSPSDYPEKVQLGNLIEELSAFKRVLIKKGILTQTEVDNEK